MQDWIMFFGYWLVILLFCFMFCWLYNLFAAGWLSLWGIVLPCSCLLFVVYKCLLGLWLCLLNIQMLNGFITCHWLTASFCVLTYNF
ncbi:hypothetical protein Hanom_Chr09g00834131 [Helianthus anomalus]